MTAAAVERLIINGPAGVLQTILQEAGADGSRYAVPCHPHPVDPQSVIRWAARLEPQPRLVIMRGAGHFFHGRLTELRDSVIDAVRGG